MTPTYEDAPKLYWLVYGPYARGVRARSAVAALALARAHGAAGEPDEVLVRLDSGEFVRLEGVK